MAKDKMETVEPLDLLLFHSDDPVSLGVEEAQRQRIGRGDYSHAAVVVKGDWVDRTPADALFLWDALIDNTHVGVRIMLVQEAVDKYVKWFPGVRIARCPLLPHVRATLPSEGSIRTLLRDLKDDYEDATYDLVLFAVCGHSVVAVVPLGVLQAVRGRRLFCSEMVAHVYQRLGLLPTHFRPADVMPLDFVGRDEDGMPRLVAEPQVIVGDALAAAGDAPVVVAGEVPVVVAGDAPLGKAVEHQ